MSKYELSDYQWEQIEECIPRKKSKCGRESRDARELMNAIIWVLRTGSPWCEIPEHYGPWRTAYNNFRRWTDNGVIEKIFLKLAPDLDTVKEIQIDSTSIKVHQHGTGSKKRGHLQVGVGKSRAGLTTKIHALVNESGKLIQFIITPGNRHDSVVAKELLDCAIKPDIYVLADRGYSSNAIRSYILSNKAISVIPPTSNRKLPWIYDKEIYKHRDHVERLFQRLKSFRRISTRYDKSLESFVSFFYLASFILSIPKFSYWFDCPLL